jgi:hypothetical protein
MRGAVLVLGLLAACNRSGPAGSGGSSDGGSLPVDARGAGGGPETSGAAPSTASPDAGGVPSVDAPPARSLDALPAPPADPDRDARSADAAPDGGGALVLTDLRFEVLPISSVRGMVRGRHRESGLCAAVVWDYSNTGRMPGRRCDDFGPSFPYILLDRGDCLDLPYGGNTDVRAGRGCIDFAAFGPSSRDVVDVSLEVDGPLFKGTIEIHGP